MGFYNDKILDLGCGYGVVGIIAGKTIGGYKVVMSDISNKATYWAKHNTIKNQLNEVRIIQSNGYLNIPDKDFSLILSNPPYHCNFSVAKDFIEEGFKRIILGGRMIMVTKRKEWLLINHPIDYVTSFLDLYWFLHPFLFLQFAYCEPNGIIM